MNRLLSIVIVLVCAACVFAQAQAGLAGKWQGATASGRPVVCKLFHSTVLTYYASGAHFCTIAAGARR